MTTILATFFIALVISLVATPLAAKLGRLAGAMDTPDTRKVHRIPTPRSGGIAIFVAFVLSVQLSEYLGTQVSNLFIWDIRNIMFIIGAFIVFVVGLVDDIHHLSARLKFLFQALAATIAFAGGLRINSLLFTDIATHSVIMSYGLTVFWFVLLINAINLIDGLDGLAGGITFFVCVILTILLLFQKQYLPAMLFAVLGGSVLGFLRYNFNPASVFMGDSGSYFLGYAIAGLSIIGSTKIQTGTVVLIPLLALGVPVFDTVLSPVRRFIVGKKLFQPDKSHIHHKLVEMGFSTRKAVLLLYSISVILCLFTLALVNIHDRRGGLFLVIVGITAIVFTRKLGYFEYLASDKLIGWFRDITDVSGLRHDRRSFLGMQIDISHSRTVEEMWQNVCRALEALGFDRADLHLNPSRSDNGNGSEGYERKDRRTNGETVGHHECGPVIWETVGQGRDDKVFHWARGQYRRKDDLEKAYILRIELPLMNGSPEKVRKLLLEKDTKKGQLDGFILRRVEQLRGTIVRTADWIDTERKGITQAVPQVAGNRQHLPSPK